MSIPFVCVVMCAFSDDCAIYTVHTSIVDVYTQNVNQSGILGMTNY